jgi:hypothetical protein
MSVLGHIVLSTCRQLAPEWNREDRIALEKELNEVTRRLQSMQQYLPCEGHLHHAQQNCLGKYHGKKMDSCPERELAFVSVLTKGHEETQPRGEKSLRLM